MSKYLLSGAKMLQISCPNCNIPLVQEKDNPRIFCANCLKEAKYVSDEKEAESLEEKLTYSVTSKSILTELENILTGKLQNISIKIASESDLNDLNHLLDTTSKILNNLQILKSFNEQN
jgi:uncharacterized Zn finger protein (UPF0148 family)